MTDKKAEIYRCGRLLFAERGFKDTNVADIMKLAGMATGTFYNYFTSKDQLFMTIFMDENALLKRRILDALDLKAAPVRVMQEMTAKNYEGMLENPILKEWYNREIFQKIEKSWKDENGERNLDFLYDSFNEVVLKWQADGKMRNDISAELIMAIFSALANIDAHKDEIGMQFFPEVLELISEFVLRGLMDTPGREGGPS